jgi:hypothetical protein
MGTTSARQALVDLMQLPAAGHNKPPSTIEFSHETVRALDAWMAEHPVIQSEEEAREAKLLHDRAFNADKDMDAERAAQVKPLNDQVKQINEQYREPRSRLQTAISLLLARIDGFRQAEEARRHAEAEEKRRAAEEAQRIADEAARRALEAKENADAGEIGLSVIAAEVEAKNAQQAALVAERVADRADKNQSVRVAGGFRRALAARTRETLCLDDAHAAIDSIGVTDKIREAILSSARDYRKQFGELPDGVNAETERAI